MRSGELCPQTWVVWGVAASFPFLLGRNPFPMAIALIAVIAVYQATRHRHMHGAGWRLLVRGVALFSAIAVLINVLTARTGDLVIVRVPEAAPLIDGPLTWNAVIYGLLACAGVLGLVLAWATVGSMLHWSSLVRLLPDRFVGFAVAGSSAINLVPQTAAALSDIREAAMARGFAPAGLKSLPVILTPMIDVGVDRSMRLAEVLESRGFGARTREARGSRPLHESAWTLLLSGAFIAAYGFVSAISWAAIAGAVVAMAGGGILALGRTSDAIRRTRYRSHPMRQRDWVVMIASLLVALACFFARERDAASLIYEPYPTVETPAANAWLLLALFGLLAPAIVESGVGAVND
jgi:energy-coupling factor transporter transmembrane protein EcfT